MNNMMNYTNGWMDGWADGRMNVDLDGDWCTGGGPSGCRDYQAVQ